MQKWEMEKNNNNLQTVYAGQGAVLGGKLHTDTTIRLESERFIIKKKREKKNVSQHTGEYPWVQDPTSSATLFVEPRTYHISHANVELVTPNCLHAH